MAGPEEALSGLPDTLRNSNRPIIIYQGGPPPYVDTRTSNALGLLGWLALITLCLGIGGYCAWTTWNPSFDRHRFSPIYSEGQPRGLIKQIEERQQINVWADGLTDFRDQVRANNEAWRFSTLTHPLLTDRQGIDLDHQGIDALREQWDAMCANIRARLYDQRLSLIEERAAELRAQRARERDPNERQRLDGLIESIRQERNVEIERRRTDSDPSLRCTPAALASVCSNSNDEAWCNPQLKRPDEFVEEEQ